MAELSISEQIKELVSKNLFVSDDLEVQMLSAPINTQEKLLPILAQMNEKQMDLFGKILKRDPLFFTRLKQIKNHGDIKNLIAREETMHLLEIQTAENQLMKELNQL